MEHSSENKNKVSVLIKMLSKHLGLDPSEVEHGIKSGDMSKITGNMNPDDAEKLKKALSDKNLAKKILGQEKAGKLLERFLGEK